MKKDMHTSLSSLALIVPGVTPLEAQNFTTSAEVCPIHVLRNMAAEGIYGQNLPQAPAIFLSPPWWVK